MFTDYVKAEIGHGKLIPIKNIFNFNESDYSNLKIDYFQNFYNRRWFSKSSGDIKKTNFKLLKDMENFVPLDENQIYKKYNVGSFFNFKIGFFNFKKNLFLNEKQKLFYLNKYNNFYLNKDNCYEINNNWIFKNNTNIYNFKSNMIMNFKGENKLNKKETNSFIYLKKFPKNYTKYKIIQIDFNQKQSHDYYRYWPTLKQKSIKEWNFDFNDYYNINKSFIKKKFRNNYKIINQNRLISTDTLIILPTNINIMVITNSYDVVHSWFVPGIGIKFDCVPGRSTHHHLYFEKPGMYYG